MSAVFDSSDFASTVSNVETAAALNEYPAMRAQPEAYPRYASFHDAMNSVLSQKYLDKLCKEADETKSLVASGAQPTFDNADALFDALGNEDA